MPDNGPYGNEREALDAPAARKARAEVDAMFNAGTFKPGDQAAPYARIIFDALDAAGVTISAYEARTVSWLGYGELATCQEIAGMITRAHAAGREASGEILGYVVVTRPPADGTPDLDTPGLDTKNVAEQERDRRQAATSAAGRHERHQVAAVITIKEE